MDVGISRLVEPQALVTFLTSALPGLRIHVDRFDDLSGSAATGEPAKVHLVLIERQGAYPAGISVFAFPQRDEPLVLVALARLLSTLLNCDAVCDGTPYVSKDSRLKGKIQLTSPISGQTSHVLAALASVST